MQHLVAVATVAVTALWLAPAAFAQSTDLYPAGDTVTGSSSPMTLINGYGLKTTCTFNPGSFVLPTKGNPSGPETVNFTTRPTFTACGGRVTVETSGTWSISIQYGSGQAVVTIPVNGFAESAEGLGGGNPAGEWKMNATWNNGFSSPVAVSGSLGFLPSSNTQNVEGKAKEFTFGSALDTLSDLTHPASLPLLGP
jgi:hypothetical protein